MKSQTSEEPNTSLSKLQVSEHILNFYVSRILLSFTLPSYASPHELNSKPRDHSSSGESGPKPLHIHKNRELATIQVYNNKHSIHLYYINKHNKLNHAYTTLY